jgi:hypothetical protein
MNRRKFLLGFAGGIAAVAGLAGRTRPAEALPITREPLSAPRPSDVETAVATPQDIEAAQVQATQWGYYGPRRRYWRRRYWRRRYWGPRRYWRRRYWGPRYFYGPRRRYWRRRYWRRRYW